MSAKIASSSVQNACITRSIIPAAPSTNLRNVQEQISNTKPLPDICIIGMTYADDSKMSTSPLLDHSIVKLSPSFKHVWTAHQSRLYSFLSNMSFMIFNQHHEELWPLQYFNQPWNVIEDWSNRAADGLFLSFPCEWKWDVSMQLGRQGRTTPQRCCCWLGGLPLDVIHLSRGWTWRVSS